MSVILVAIGRNEGERLRRCLQSALASAAHVAYVDSGSTDDSVATAHALGVQVVGLDMSRPFTAARARNEGFRAAVAVAPGARFVQFVDGDCELQPGWIQSALAFMASHPNAAVVCGRRRERFPARSIYNQLCDIEWNTLVGEASACGGDALMRVEAFQRVGGYRDELIAGEEPELCVRLRAQGWQVWRLDAEMTLHDAAMTHFGQWWQRTMRGGYAFAEGAHLHGAPPERHWVRESYSAWLWGLGLPLALLLVSLAWWPAAWGWLAYPLQMLRLAVKAQGAPTVRLARGFFLVLGKFAEAAGQAKFWWHRRRSETAHLIEYK